MSRQFTGEEVNTILQCVRDIEHDDGDVQLSLLAMALVIACRSCGIEKRHAVKVFAEQFETGLGLKLERFHDATLQ